MINNKILFIGIVSQNKERSNKILKTLYDRANPKDIKFYNENIGSLRIDNCVYMIFDKNNNRKYKIIDQLIFDYALNLNIAKEFLKYSCVSENFQIIDDRKILL